MSKANKRKEFFFVAIAKALTCVCKDVNPPEDWYEDCEIELHRAAEKFGYEIYEAIHIDYLEDKVVFWFITDDVLKVAEKEFRGYPLDREDSLVIDEDFVEQATKSGTTLFKAGDSLDIINIVHNDLTNSIDYHLADFVDSGHNTVVTIERKSDEGFGGKVESGSERSHVDPVLDHELSGSEPLAVS